MVSACVAQPGAGLQRLHQLGEIVLPDDPFELESGAAAAVPDEECLDTSDLVESDGQPLAPAKFVHNEDGRRGSAVNSLVSGGCIVSGAEVTNSVLFSNVLVRSHSVIEDTVVLPDVQINRNCRIKRAVIDRRCKLPDGLVIGEDPVLDAQRFHRTENGVVLVTRGMLKKLAL
ncbi:MAG: glucose-phosphate adenylyltransferase [Pseudomonadota bacterium]